MAFLLVSAPKNNRYIQPLGSFLLLVGILDVVVYNIIVIIRAIIMQCLTILTFIIHAIHLQSH